LTTVGPHKADDWPLAAVFDFFDLKKVKRRLKRISAAASWDACRLPIRAETDAQCRQ